MIIHVTQEDIDNGIRGSCDFCPIALALRRTLNTKVNWFTDFLIERSDNPDSWIQFSTRSVWLTHLYNFARAFDTEEPVIPFSFHLSAECFML
jgi:hypothetical protein